MNVTRLVLALSVPAVVFATALFGYAGRSLWYSLADGPAAFAAVGPAGAVGVLLGCVVTAAVGALAGPGAAMVLGGLVLGVGNGLVAADLFLPGVAAASAGRAMVAVGGGAAIARAVGNPNASGRMALFMLTYAGVNLAAMLSGPAAALGHNAPAFALGVCAAGAAVAGLLALPAAGLPWARAEDLEPPRAEPTVHAVATGVAVAGALVMAVNAVGSDAQFGAFVADAYDTPMSWVWSVNPIVAVGSSLLGAVVFGALGFSGVRVPPLAVAALGLLLAGLGMAPTAAGWGMIGAMVLLGVGALGEPLVYAGIWAQVSGGVHPRLVPVLGAIGYLAGTAPALVGGVSRLVGVDAEAAKPLWASAAGVLLLVAAAAAGSAAFLLRKADAEADSATATGFGRAPDPYGYGEG